MSGIDKCSCVCHTRSGIRHVIACCKLCPTCHERINFVKFEQHTRTCTAPAPVPTEVPTTPRSLSRSLMKQPSFRDDRLQKRERLQFIKNGDQEVHRTGEALCPDNWEDLLDLATTKLGVLYPIRRIFDTSGNEIFNINDVKGTLFCSGGEPFKKPAHAALQKTHSFKAKAKTSSQASIERPMERAPSSVQLFTADRARQTLEPGDIAELKSMLLSLLREDKDFRDDVRTLLLAKRGE